jgi:D-alanyl-D-alanine carboxypeptidase
MNCDNTRPTPRLALAALCVAALPTLALGAPEWSATLEPKIDSAVTATLKSTGVPAASIAIVVDGRIAYLKSYGLGHLSPARAADNSMRYCIGSVSKEFLAAAFVMLQSEGRVSLDDQVGRYVPNLGAAGQTSLRQLLSHTAGVRDYWPQDYVFADMLEPISRDGLLDRWARQPLDFTPGERWQYSNTGYVLAGTALEKITGQSLFSFLHDRIFAPLKMTSVIDIDQGQLGTDDAQGYTAYAMGPLQPSPRAAPGWLFAAGELGMTAQDLARWDISLIAQDLLSAAAYHELETETLLKNGAGTRYALGLAVHLNSERRELSHSGEDPGFISNNTIYPDDRAAIVVLTNSDASEAASDISDKIEEQLFITGAPQDAARTGQMTAILSELRQGRIDRSLLSSHCNQYFSPQALRDAARALAHQGKLKSLTLTHSGVRGGMDFRVYKVEFSKHTYDLVTYTWPDGKIEQYLLSPH